MKSTSKIISVLLALCLLMCAFPAMAFAEVTEYPLIVNNVPVTSQNCSDILGDGKVAYNPTSKTLTLRSAKLSCSEKPSESADMLCAIHCDADLTIVLDGSSTIEVDGANETLNAVFGILANNLTISEGANGGSLTINVKAKDSGTVGGIYASGSIAVNSDSVTVTADGGVMLETATAPTANDRSTGGEPDKSDDKPVIGDMPDMHLDLFGAETAVPGSGGSSDTYAFCTAIYAGNGYTQSKGTVSAQASNATNCTAMNVHETLTVTGGKLTVVAGDGKELSNGIYCDTINISGSSTGVSATGGNTEGSSFGIYADEDMTVTGGTVTASSGTSEYTSSAICVDRAYTQTAGTVTATGGASWCDNSIGFYVYEGPVKISGGTLTAVGAENSYDSYGICAYGSLELTGGTVKATGGDAYDDSYGASIYYLTVTNGTLELRSGSPDDDSFGLDVIDMLVSGGTVNVVCEGSDYGSYGVYTNESYEQTGGKVTASAGDGRYSSWGLFLASSSTTDILGGTLTATSGNANDETAGIYSYSSTLNIGGADTVVTARSGSSRSYMNAGICSRYRMVIDGATVTAEGGANTINDSYGVCVGEITVKCGVLRGISGESRTSSNGIYTDGMTVAGGEVFGTANATKSDYINAICVEDYNGMFSTTYSGKLEVRSGRVTALCNDSVNDSSASAIWAKNGITAPEHYTATGAQETYASGIKELRQKVSGTPVVLKADSEVVRLSGNSRVLTAIEISKKGWESGSDTVILASGNNYADVLAVVPYAYKLDAPVLLSVSATLDADILAEIERLGATKAVILGGTAAVPQAVEDSIKAEGLTVERIAGSSRNETAAKIAQKLAPASGDAFLVSNANFADAISCSSVAALMDAPILYINADGTLPEETRTALTMNNIATAYVIGGTGAVGEAAETQLDTLSITCNRVFGNNRYATSVAVYNEFADEYATTRHAAATGKAFPDATAGAAFAAKNGMHIFLVDEGMPDSIASTLRGRGVETLYIFGGTSAVTAKTVETIL